MAGDGGAITVRCLTTGVARQKAGERGVRRYIVDEWQDETLPVNVFLVHHPSGICLFDAGQTAEATLPGYFPRWHPFLRLSRFELTPEDEVGPQLRRLGVAPEAVRWVVLSHLHTDHVGGLDAFRESEIVVARTEWGLATGLEGRIRGYLPQHWPKGLKPSLIDFKGPAIGPFPASFALTEDRRLTLLPTPGHTRGHMSMLVRGDQFGCLLAGDLVHAPDELAGTWPDIDDFCREEQLVVLTTHDPDAPRLLR